MGSHQECLKACKKQIKMQPANPLAWKYAGKSFLALGQLQKSKKCLIKEQHKAKKDPDIPKDIGNIYSNLGSYSEASRKYNISLSIDQDMLQHSIILG